MTERVFAYIDGFNLYFGLKSQNLRHLYWLNVPGAIRRLLERREQLEVTKYFTSRVSGPPGKVQRQNDYIDALASLPNVRLYFGSYQTHPRTCASCTTPIPPPSPAATPARRCCGCGRPATSSTRGGGSGSPSPRPSTNWACP
jgi:hypothetical protein